jgi:hypothetical protein
MPQPEVATQDPFADGELVCASWRGSPQLVAHIARTALEANGYGEEPSPASPGCVIEVDIGADAERFETPEQFCDQVSTEALRDFERILVKTGSPTEPGLAVRLSRLEPPRKKREPDEGSHVATFIDVLVTTWLSIVRPGGGVTVLSAPARNHDERERALERIRAAIRRGSTPRHERLGFGIASALLVILAICSVYYLISGNPLAPDPRPASGSVASDPAYLPFWLAGASVAFALVGWCVNWLRPPVEVAAIGQTRLWRAVKFVGTPLIGLVVAGIGKAIWG